jgi:prepilin-type N-terminal cleavage/methylation domain-containing protein
MKNQNNKAFTLPELIVVITILWTLATIWFISFQWHSSDARDSKRISDVSNLSKQLELIKTKWEDIFSFVDNDISTIQDNIQISWYTWSVQLAWKYLAWDPNYINLELPWDWFTDPKTDDPYKIWVTSFWKRYEVATAIENSWIPSIYTTGTWLPRTSLETIVENDKTIWKIYYMSGSTKNDILLEINDMVKISGSTNTYKIMSIQLDRIILDRNISPIWNNLSLSEDESIHLIKNWSWDFPIEEDKWNDFSPYNLIP